MMKCIVTAGFFCLLLKSAIGQTEVIGSLGLLRYGLCIDDSGTGYAGSFIEESKNTVWGSVKIALWGRRFPLAFEARLKHKTGSMQSQYGGVAHRRYTEFSYNQYRLSNEVRYRFKLIKSNFLYAELGGFIDVPVYSNVKGEDDGIPASRSGDEFMKITDFGFSAALGLNYMLNKQFGINAQVAANQSLRWNWHHNLYPVRDVSIGAGLIWLLEGN